MSTAAWFLISILQTSPSVVIDVGYKLDSQEECKQMVSYFAKQEPKGIFDCWKIEAKALVSKEEQTKRRQQPKETLGKNNT